MCQSGKCPPFPQGTPQCPILEGWRGFHFTIVLNFLLMRKIETEMNAAISNDENWASGNTTVTFDSETNESTVYLHGNKIAEVGDNYIRLFDGGYQSNTTKSRLHAILREHGALGECVFQKDFEWFIRLWNGTEFFTTEFRNSMKLGALPADLCLAG